MAPASGFGEQSQSLGLNYAALDLFGLTDDATGFINVSDGGHFENLGVYELIRRGCRYVIVSEAGEDGSFGLEDLGNVVRKCRTDFGVDIEIQTDPIRDRDEKGRSATHCVIGKIRYLGIPKHDAEGNIVYRETVTRNRQGAIVSRRCEPRCEEAWLVYVKPSVTGHEPYDVLEYNTRVPEFPDESTRDQWFSESQFEAYRRLGQHIAHAAFSRFPIDDDHPFRSQKTFERLYRHWHAPSPAIAKHATANALEYNRVMELIRSREELKGLDPALFPNLPSRLPAGRNEFYLCNALIQLAEKRLLRCGSRTELRPSSSGGMDGRLSGLGGSGRISTHPDYQ